MIENSVACQKLTIAIIAMGRTRKKNRTIAKGDTINQPLNALLLNIFCMLSKGLEWGRGRSTAPPREFRPR
jgi:hypothetical protein